MRRKDKEITDPAAIDHMLASSRLCRIAMVDADGTPYLVPLNYGYKDGTLYFHSAAAGRKIDILSRAPRVCFEIEAHADVVEDACACEWTTKYRSVIGYGSVAFITADDEKRRALDIIMAQHGRPGPNEYNANQVRSIVVMRLAIESLTAKQSGNWNE